MSATHDGAQWDYKGKSALVVGGTSGIGLAIAKRLLEAGAKVAVAARRADELEAFTAGGGDAAIGVETDITDSVQVARMVDRTVDAFGKLDVAFNVAGIFRRGPIVSLTEEDWDAVHATNLRAAFVCLKHQAVQMIKQGNGGAIVNVTSVSAHIPGKGAAVYTSAKAGLDMLTRNAALELAEHRIRVNALAPGLVETPAVELVLTTPAILKAYKDRIPLDRPANVAEMTGPALFLGSDEASYITGATLVADGGWSQTGYPDPRSFA
ncbi:SDR family NAD(P)-dependent oxidoreductase [Sphingobium sp.]|uniref:SDR family NAD(P)-dependent oxidoreductase n=1 Tax=Sphingobium sp. TaxID=1912891 RepID=UPI0028BDA3AF|nr:SDR family NAD(P)-dependent oxidoreductase [Sphingobium sp.]